MSNTRTSDLNQTNLALASLAASFAKSLGEQFPAFLPAFSAELEKTYHKFQSSGAQHVEAMQTLRWVNEFLKDS